MIPFLNKVGIITVEYLFKEKLRRTQTLTPDLLSIRDSVIASEIQSLQLKLFHRDAFDIYIYIYVCVCVYVCV